MDTPEPVNVITPETLKSGFTQSELGLMDECTMKWQFRYNNRLQRNDNFSWSFYVGTAWHKFQEELRKTGEIPITYLEEIPKETIRDLKFEETLEYWTEIFPTLQIEYFKRYYAELKPVRPFLFVERELTAKYNDILLRGKIDHAEVGLIRDYKTTSSAWLISGDGWHFKLQFMMYCWLMGQNYPDWQLKAFEFQMDIFQKPGLKQTKKETFVGYLERIKKDIQERPEYYFKRETFEITPSMVQRFEKTVLKPKIDKLILAIEYPEIVSNRNTNACNAYGHQCDFFPICERGWKNTRFHFSQRDNKHQELE